jgi:hypothetical protein
MKTSPRTREEVERSEGEGASPRVRAWREVSEGSVISFDAQAASTPRKSRSGLIRRGKLHVSRIFNFQNHHAEIFLASRNIQIYLNK